MKPNSLSSAILLIGLAACPSRAQSYPTTTTPRPGTSSTPNSQRGHQQPCWQQVGVSQSAEQQRRQIEENTRAQVETVCNDSSLSQQQKQQKIHQLHEEARKQVEGLLSPQQEQAMKACREQRRGGRGEGGDGMHTGGRGGEGPCGEMTEPASSRPQGRGGPSQPQSSPQAAPDPNPDPK